MKLLDLTILDVTEKHSKIQDSVKSMLPGEKLCLKSNQDLVVLLSHLEEEYGEQFNWEYSQNDEGVFSLVLSKKKE